MRASRKTSLSVFAATVLAFVTPITSASADQGDTLTGGCGASTGYIYVAAYSQEASGTPSTATVSCWIDVNGVEQPGTRLTVTGSGVIAGAAEIVYSSAEDDVVSECQQVTFADGSTWTAKDGNVGTDCMRATSITLTGPQFLDPVVCPLYIALYAETGGGVFGILRIHSDGDLYVAQPLGVGYIRIWNCPPY